MLWNYEKQTVQVSSDCLTCQYFNKKEKKCGGLGLKCFEFDNKTNTIIDPITGLPLKIKGE